MKNQGFSSWQAGVTKVVGPSRRQLYSHVAWPRNDYSLAESEPLQFQHDWEASSCQCHGIYAGYLELDMGHIVAVSTVRTLSGLAQQRLFSRRSRVRTFAGPSTVEHDWEVSSFQFCRMYGIYAGYLELDMGHMVAVS